MTLLNFADTAASISIGKVGEVDSIPELMEVLENSGLKEKFGIVESTQKQAIPDTIEPIHSSEVENNIVTNHNQQEQNSSAVNDVNQNVAFGEMPKQPVQEEKQQPSPEVHEDKHL